MGDLSEFDLDDLSLDEDKRPNTPAIGNGTAPSNNAHHLAEIHRSHLMEIAKARQVLRFVQDGQAAPLKLMEAMKAMTLTENMRVFGTLCGQECRMLGFHHNAEELHLFPELEGQKIEGLTAVVAKLRAEHKIVHELLERLTKAAANLVSDPSEIHFDNCSEVFQKLETVVKSHFSYEETELRDAIDYLVQEV
ncbi:MAG: hemerythrin domain-containing protein [Pseudomonadota bacterium]